MRPKRFVAFALAGGVALAAVVGMSLCQVQADPTVKPAPLATQQITLEVRIANLEQQVSLLQGDVKASRSQTESLQKQLDEIKKHPSFIEYGPGGFGGGGYGGSDFTPPPPVILPPVAPEATPWKVIPVQKPLEK